MLAYTRISLSLSVCLSVSLSLSLYIYIFKPMKYWFIDAKRPGTGKTYTSMRRIAGSGPSQVTAYKLISLYLQANMSLGLQKHSIYKQISALGLQTTDFIQVFNVFRLKTIKKHAMIKQNQIKPNQKQINH